jgi:hypothetical protein
MASLEEELSPGCGLATDIVPNSGRETRLLMT